MEQFKGDICVSLCQCQGGTPLDNPRRELGNSWQVVYRAARAGWYLFVCLFFLNDEFDRLLRSSVTWRLFGIDELVS